MTVPPILTIASQFSELDSEELTDWLITHQIDRKTAWRTLYRLGLPNKHRDTLRQLYGIPWGTVESFHTELRAIIQNGGRQEEIIWYLENCQVSPSIRSDQCGLVADQLLDCFRRAEPDSGELEENVLLQYWQRRL